MARRTVSLAVRIGRHLSGSVDFPVTLKPLYYRSNGMLGEVPGRRVVVREDSGDALGIVSDRYTLVPHQTLLTAVERALTGLNLAETPRGIYLDRQGARMRALYKFPGLAQPVRQDDAICPCVKIQNTYDGTSRVMLHIGAFRFVCTNLAVGGGGVFAGGFMAVHVGELPVEEVSSQLETYLKGFDDIVEIYRVWVQQELDRMRFFRILQTLPKRTAKGILGNLGDGQTVYTAYNAATRFATHQMRSYHGAFELLRRINLGFQEQFPIQGS